MFKKLFLLAALLGASLGLAAAESEARTRNGLLGQTFILWLF